MDKAIGVNPNLSLQVKTLMSLTPKLNEDVLSSFVLELIRTQSLPIRIDIETVLEDTLEGDERESTEVCELVIKFLHFKWTVFVMAGEICTSGGGGLQISREAFIEIDDDRRTFNISDSEDDTILTFPLDILGRILDLLEGFVSQNEYVGEETLNGIKRLRERSLKKIENPSK